MPSKEQSSFYTNMFGFLFGWRKASKCKKVMKKLECRLKLARSKTIAIVNRLREDIASLSRNGNQHIAYTKIDKLYMDANLEQVYELLDNYCEFVLMNLSYIKRHRKCPYDINEAVSSLIFASEKLGEELPELKAIRELFEERYGHIFASMAAELLPGNRVNGELKAKMSMKTVPEEAKQRLFDEITRDSFFPPPSFLESEFKPSPPQPQTRQLMVDQTQVKSTQPHHYYNRLSSPIMLATSSPSIMSEAFPITNEDIEIEEDTFSLPSSSRHEYPEPSVVYLDDVEEFKSPSREDKCFLDDQDQRLFIFPPLHTLEADQGVMMMNQEDSKRKIKRQRRRSSSKEYMYKKQVVNDVEFEVYYSKSPNQTKHKKKTVDGGRICEEGKVVDPFIPSFRLWLDDEIKTETRSRSVSSSPRHLHPKLPDCDELEAVFKALKRKITGGVN